MQETMKAMVYRRYGEPDEVLEMSEVPVPSFGDKEVLVKVHAVAVNPLDWHLMTGKPAFARLSFGLLRPKRNIPGNDLAGTVEAVGEKVTEFRVGDEVFGEAFEGGLAEYVAVSAEGLVSKPENVTFEEAASVPVAAFTALQGLRDWGGMEPGGDVLIIGASGGVGTFAVQIARALGAGHVTGVASTRNLERARELGADEVVDYTKDDYAKLDRKYDVIFDGPGNRPVSVYGNLLKPDGTYVLIGGPKGDWLAPLPRLLRLLVGSALGGMNVGNGTARRSRSDLVVLRDWLVSGEIKPVIDRNYKLEEAGDALTYQGTFHAQGKIVITV
jgi:NADPH:quinone reductase-like Zn-dependent oxidoreductase